MTGRRRTDKRVTTHPQFRPLTAGRLSGSLFRSWFAFQQQIASNMLAMGWPLTCPRAGANSAAHWCCPIGSFWDLYLTIPETSRPVLISEVRVIWAAENEYGIEFLRVTARERTQLRHFIWKRMNRSTLRGGRPLFTLIDHSSTRRLHLKSLL